MPRGVRLRLLPAVRPDRDEPDRDALPARAPAHAQRRRRHPVVNVQVAIMDDDGGLLPQGDEGEIVYRGPHTMTAYLKNAEATRRRSPRLVPLRRRRAFDEDGMLWFRDRTKDVIKTGGENVASIEVEKAIYAADPDVAEVVVVGLPHERWSEAITAVVVPGAGATIDTDELIGKVKELIDPLQGAQVRHRPSTSCRAPRPARSRRTSCATSTASHYREHGMTNRRYRTHPGPGPQGEDPRGGRRPDGPQRLPRGLDGRHRHRGRASPAPGSTDTSTARPRSWSPCSSG